MHHYLEKKITDNTIPVEYYTPLVILYFLIIDYRGEKINNFKDDLKDANIHGTILYNFEIQVMTPEKIS